MDKEGEARFAGMVSAQGYATLPCDFCHEETPLRELQESRFQGFCARCSAQALKWRDEPATQGLLDALRQLRIRFSEVEQPSSLAVQEANCA